MQKHLQGKLRAIQKHIDRNFKRWFRTYPGLKGVHLGQKKVNGMVLENSYSIVFHVTKKRKKMKKPVPEYFYIGGKNKIKIKVLSDVIEAGHLQLNGVKIGDTVKNEQADVTGTISFYFESPNGTYAGSNMHVLAPSQLNQGKTSYDVRKGDTPQTIDLSNDFISAAASLIVARFNNIDFGFAKVDNPASPGIIELVIKDTGPPSGMLSLTLANFNTFNMSFFGISSQLTSCTVTDIGAKKFVAEQGIFLTNLIKLNKCTQDGDSGGPLFDAQRRLAGVIVGMDDDASYALHVNDIIDFFQTSKL